MFAVLKERNEQMLEYLLRNSDLTSIKNASLNAYVVIHRIRFGANAYKVNVFNLFVFFYNVSFMFSLISNYAIDETCE